MNTISMEVSSSGPAARKQSRLSLKPIAALLVLGLMMALWPARAEGPDDGYLEIFNLIQQADDLDAAGKAALAKTKYQQALTALVSFQKTYPNWNTKLVSARLNYLTEKATALPEKPSAPVEGAEATNALAAKPGAKAGPSASTRAVKLLEAGAEPRKALRLQPAPNDKQTLGMTIKMAAETKVGEAVSPAMKLPALQMTLDSTVKEVADDGSITCGLVLRDLSVSDEPGLAEAMKAVFAGIKELSGAGTFSSRGVSESIQVKAPAGSAPQSRLFADQMQELFTQLVVPLPEEAVGPGAKWEVKMPVKSQGMTISQTATYELVSLEGERVTVKTRILQQAAHQKIQNPAMPEAKADLTKMTGQGSGERTFDLAHVLPVAGAQDVHTEAIMAMNMGGQKQSMTMKMDMNLRLETK